MDTQPLNVKIDSGSAQADLHALARALDETGAAANRMAAGLSQGMAGADRAIKGSMANMERFAQVAAAINKIKINSDGTKSVAEFAQVMNAVARTKEIEKSKIDSWSKFIQIGAQTSRLKMDGGAVAAMNSFIGVMDRAAKTRDISSSKLASWVKFIEVGARAAQLRGGGAAAMVGFNMFAQAMDNASKSRAISQAKLKSWVDFIEVAARSQRLKFDPATARSLLEFGRAMEGFKAPPKGSIDRLDKMFKVLATAKPIPNARAVAHDLDMIAASATRAAAALSAMPGGRFNVGGGGRRAAAVAAGGGGGGSGAGTGMDAAAAGAGKAHGALNTYAGGAQKAARASHTLGERLRGLNHRFDLTYQAGTAFSMLFSTFTIGAMIRSVYDASVNMMKLDKAMLFSTKSFEGSKRASAEFIGTVFDMGLALDQVSEPFGRFTISAGAVGMTAADSSQIFKSVTQTLQVVGASAEQTGYAMYGLTQMIQKGKVSSEEFNRQIGEQIPGNAEAGRRALEKMTGQAVSMQQFFKKMSLGEIMSPEFTKLWAQELNNMFSPLMGMIRDRPDIAINRLGTALTVFRVAMGKSGFVQEIGLQFNRLADLIGKTENGVFKLTPKFQDLADKLGRNLANGMRMAGDAMVWLATNFDKVMFAAKTVATLFVARTFLSWGQSALTTASSIQGLTKAMFGLKMAQDAVAASDAVSTSGSVAKAAAASKAAAAAQAVNGPGGASMPAIQNWRNANGRAPTAPLPPRSPDMPAAAASFGRRQTPMAQRTSGATASVMASRGALTKQSLATRMGSMGSTVAAGASAVVGAAPAAGAAAMSGLAIAGKTLVATLGVLGVAAVATGAALTILSDRTTEINGVGVQFKDILTGAMNVISTKFLDWFNRTFNSTKSLGDLIHDLGRPIKAMVDGLLWMGEVIFDTINVFVNLGKAIVALANGDTAGAKAAMDNTRQDWADNNIFDPKVVAARTATTDAATLAAANERLTQELANADSERNAREGARLLAEMHAAEKQEAAAAMQLEAAKVMSRSMETPTVGAVMERLNNIVSGKFLADNKAQGALSAAAGAGASAGASGPGSASAGATSVTMGPPLPAMTFSRTVGGKTYTASSPEELYMAVFNGMNAAPAAQPAARSSSTRAPIEGFLGDLRTAMRDNLTPAMDGGARLRANLDNANPQARAAADARQAREREAAARDVATQAREQARNEQLRAAVQNQTSGSASDMALGMIRKHEGFRADRYWDVDAYRAGYGSDTVTDPNSGRVSKVTQNTRGVTRDQAEADLRRRVMTEFAPRAEAAVGKEQWAGLTAAVQAALTSVTYNYGSLPDSVARAAKTGDAATIATSVEALGVHNNGINAGRRREEAQVIRTGSVGASDLSGTGGASGMPGTGDGSPDEPTWKKAWDKRNNDYKALQTFLALPDPASQAVGRASAMAEQLNDLAASDEKRIAEFGQEASVFSPENLKQIEKGWKRVGKEISDALNPVSAGTRQMKMQNDLLSLTLRGRGQDAEWQEKINDLREQGYDIPLMKDEAKWTEHINNLRVTGLDVQAESLNVAKQQWEIERARGQTLEREAQLMATLNEARLRISAGGASRRDTYFADLVNQSSEGGSYEQKKANLSANDLAILGQTADVQDMADRAEALRSMAVDTAEQMATATMSASQRAFRATYREALSALTGMTNASLQEMEAQASDAMKGLASGVANLRDELENQPGFQRWVNALEPFDKRIQDIKGQFLDGLSDGITDSLMGEEVDWNGIWKNIRREVTKASVDNAIGDLMGFMGIKRGGVKLSPEAQATVEALSTNHNDLKTTLEAQTARLVESIATREGSREAEEAAMEAQTDLVAKQVAALSSAADNLGKIVTMLGGEGTFAGGAVQRSVDALNDERMALQSGNGYDATGRAIPNTSILTAPRIVADAGDEQLMRSVGDGRMADATSIISGMLAARKSGSEVMDPMAPVSLSPLTASLPSLSRLTAEPSLQGSLPTAPDNLGRNRDTTSIWRKAINLFGGSSSGTSERTSRFSTAGAAATAPAAGPLALATDMASAGTGSTGAEGAALQAAASALMGSADLFNGSLAQFQMATEKFNEAIVQLSEAAAALGAGGSGGGGGMPSIPGLGGGDATSGFTFEGKSFAPDLTGLYADGGFVSGRGGPRSDDINARLSNGEFVINAKATTQHRDLLEAINGGKAYASGGLVDGLPGYAGGGWFSDMFAGAKANIGSKFAKPTMSNVFGRGKNGKADSPLSFVGEMFGKGRTMEERGTGLMTAAATVNTLIDLFKKEKTPEKDPEAVKGVIGEHRGVTVDATAIAAHSNPIADAINMVANMATGGTWGKVDTYREMALGFAKQFADGGYVSNAGMDWSKAPHYDTGTANTSNGGMPAIVHPNEAIIPLPNGRSVPVDMGNVSTGGGSQVTSNITIIAPNPDAFRKSQGSIQRQQNRDLKRASTRNLS